jgi:hypothetical protein
MSVLLIGLVTAIAVVAFVCVCVFAMSLQRSARLLPVSADRFEQRRRRRLGRRSSSALL